MTNDFIEREHQTLFQTYKRLNIVVERADGCRIYDKNGKSYLDFLAGIAVNALGHGHLKIIEAVFNQTRRYMHLSNYFYQEPQIELAEKISERTGFGRVFFTNSGTEAMEGALKLVRKWGNANNRKEIIAFSGGFHGRTYGALSIMDKPLYKDGMEPFLPNCRIIPYNDTIELENNLNENTCAVVLEFLQGEGGIVSAEPEFINKLDELRTKFGFLVIADEIQSGIGRTGKFFAFEHYGFSPDIITVAKGLGGGLPLGAILAKEELAGVWDKGMHGTTNGGNAVACAAGRVVLDELNNGILDNVNKIGTYFKDCLMKIKSEFPDKITEVRGRGLMLGLLLSFDAWTLVEALLERGVITNAASGNVLRLVPPLILSRWDVDVFIRESRFCMSNMK